MTVITGRLVGSSGPTALPVPTVGQAVQNVTELRALVGSASLPAVYLVQYSATLLQRGGDIFYWDAVAATDDGVTRFNAGGLASSGAGWQRAYSDVITAEAAGAVGDGVTADDVALQRGLLAAAGRTFALTAGSTYLLSDPTTPLIPASGTTIDMRGATITCPAIADENNFVFDLDGGIDNIEIRDGVLVGETALTGTPVGFTSAQGIRVKNATNVRLKRLDVSAFWWDGIIIWGPANGVLLEDIESHNNRRNNCSIIGGSNIRVVRGNYDNAGVTADDSQAPMAGIDLETDSGGGNTVDVVDFEGVGATGNDIGLYLQQGTGARPTKVRVLNCRTPGNTNFGIVAFAIDELTVRGNVASGCVLPVLNGSGAAGIAISSCTKVKVNGNHVEDCTRGIYLGWNAGLVATGNSCVGRFDDRNAQTVSRSSSNLVATDHGFVDGQAVIFTTTNTLPSPLAVGTAYYVIWVDANTFQVATTYANSQTDTEIALSDAGTGTHTARDYGGDADGLVVTHTTGQGSFDCRVADNDVRGFQGNGLAVTISSGVSVIGNRVRDNGQTGLYLSAAMGAQAALNDVTGSSRETDDSFPDIYVGAASDGATVALNRCAYHDRYMTGDAEATTSADQVTLDVNTTNQYLATDFLAGVPIVITAGTGAGGSSTITDYNPTTRVALTNSFGASAPGTGSTYELRWPNKASASIQVAAGSTGVRVLDNDVSNGEATDIDPAALVRDALGMLSGDGPPEGVVDGTRGTLYADTGTLTEAGEATLWIAQQASGNTGWVPANGDWVHREPANTADSVAGWDENGDPAVIPLPGFVTLPAFTGEYSAATLITTTTDADQVVATVPIPADFRGVFRLELSGVRTTSADFKLWWSQIGVDNPGGSAAAGVIGSVDIVAAGEAGTEVGAATVGVNFSAGNAVVVVTPANTNAVRWCAIVKLVGCIEAY